MDGKRHNDSLVQDPQSDAHEEEIEDLEAPAEWLEEIRGGVHPGDCSGTCVGKSLG